MAPIKDYIKVKVTGDSDAVTSELYVENTIENPAWYTVEDNHVSLVSENVEKVIKLETDMLDDCMWESRIEITKDVSNQNSVELPLESQDVAVNNIYLNHENTSDKIFHCNICGKSFVLNYLLKNHLAEHKRQINRNTNKCKYCGKRFKLKFGLNRHIQKHHNSMHKSKYRSKFTEHKNIHEKDQTNFDTIPNIKLCKLNGVWKSKTNEFKCNICFQKCYSEKNLVEHMETHDNSQTQCNYCLDYVSVSELNYHMENIHNEHLFKCQKCNQQFKKQQHLNCHLIHCLRSSYTKSNKVCGKYRANEKTCSACGITFNNSLSLTNHTTIGCKHYTCKYCGQFFSKRHFWLKHMDVHKKVEKCAILKASTDETSTIREYNQTEGINDSFNINGRQLLSRDVTERNSSDHTSLVNSNSTVASTAPHTYIPNNDIISNSEPTETLTNSLERNSSNLIHLVPSESTIVSVPPTTFPEYPIDIDNSVIPNMLHPDDLVETEYFPTPVPVRVVQNKMINLKQEQFFHNTVREHFQRQLNIRQYELKRQQSALSINPHNSIANNNRPVLDFRLLSIPLGGIDSSNRINLANRNRSLISAASHNSMANNNSPVINVKQEQNLSTTLRGINSSNRINLVNRNGSIVSAASHNSMSINNSPVTNVKQEKNLSTTLRGTNSSDQTNLANRNESIISAASHNSMANNNSPVINIKQEKNLSTTLRRTNSTDQTNLPNRNESIVSAAPHNSISNNNSSVINIKQEQNLCTNARENNSSDQVDSVNSNESISANEPQGLMAKPNPINISNNNIASTVRETPYFCIRKLPNIKNGFCSNDYDDQTSQNNVIFICRICKNSPSTDIHSFALHMSDHSECNMHECIVCDKTFNSVVLWTDHMTYHQKQIDFNVSTVQFNPLETESTTLEAPINSENMEPPQVCTNLRNRKLKISLMNDLQSDTTRLNSAKKIKYQYDCSTCTKVFPSKSALQVHQTLHNKPLSFSCRYCSKIFSGKGPCTNHEKSHIIPDKQLVQNDENIKLEPVLIQNSISIEDNNTDFETMSIKHIKINKPSSIKKTNFCNLCNRKFTKRCYFTNHMMIKHNLNPNTPKQLPSIDSNEPIIQSENIELTNEYKNKLPVPVNNKNNNLNNHVNKRNEKKSTVCMSCNKHFAHLGALTNHMRVHYYKPYKCQYCSMQFSKKRPYIMHEKKHVLKNEVKSATNKNKNSIGIEVHDEPQIEHCNGFEFVHTQVDDNSSGTNCMDITHLWFSCDVCEEKFSTPLQLNVHRNSHSGIVPFVCKICNRSFQLKFRWNWHLKVHYEKYNSNSKSKQLTNNLNSNISKRKVESIHHIDKMKCRYCKKEYNSISQWKKHMTMSKVCRRHCKSNLPEFTSNKTAKNSSKSGRYRCNICEKTYSTTSNRNVHKKNVHNVYTTDLDTHDNAILQKDKPMDIIQQKLAIKKHNRSNHTNGTKCGLCGKIYSSVGNLSRHISIIHAQTFKPITCDVCGSTFKHKFSYQEHLRTNHKQLFKHYLETNPKNKITGRKIMEVNKKNTMKYFCKICKVKFADNITLQEHSKIHTLNMYMCKDCGQQFETNVTLGNHILENHKANISTSSINEHVENYESKNASLELIDYKRVQCKICLKVLNSPKYLRLHMRLHTGVKPFKCDKCNQAFRFNSNLRVHQKKDSCCIP